MKRLYFITQKAYNAEVFRIVKELSGLSSGVYYVTLNKTAAQVQQTLSENGVSEHKMHYLDAVTPHLLTIKPNTNCEYLESLERLDTLAELILTGVKRENVDTVVIDSVSSLLVYKSAPEVLQFIHYLVPILEHRGVHVVFFTLLEDLQKPMLDQVRMLFDETKIIENPTEPKKGFRRWF